MKLKTERLLLRQIEKKDIESLVRNINNLKVSRWLLVVPYPYKRKDAIWYINNCRKKARKKPREDYNFAIELLEEKAVIGGISVNKVDRYQKTATVGYWLGQDYWRQGYGSEALEALLKFAFNRLKLRRLEADIFSENPSSGKLLEKFGFKPEGYRKQAKRCKADGNIHDLICYGLLRKDYK